eukprot:comp23426_c0_seq2/m.38979 comp23426_c0_seq2/g.38979  ORF comp23426_c0_seq2/g.38979 comp23426_c0_seq2/m.38979 type:complete len:947 (-) comp23426_c0_seq2:20-2860(-)
MVEPPIRNADTPEVSVVQAASAKEQKQKEAAALAMRLRQDLRRVEDYLHRQAASGIVNSNVDQFSCELSKRQSTIAALERDLGLPPRERRSSTSSVTSTQKAPPQPTGKGRLRVRPLSFIAANGTPPTSPMAKRKSFGRRSVSIVTGPPSATRPIKQTNRHSIGARLRRMLGGETQQTKLAVARSPKIERTSLQNPKIALAQPRPPASPLPTVARSTPQEINQLKTFVETATQTTPPDLDQSEEPSAKIGQSDSVVGPNQMVELLLKQAELLAATCAEVVSVRKMLEESQSKMEKELGETRTHVDQSLSNALVSVNTLLDTSRLPPPTETKPTLPPPRTPHEIEMEGRLSEAQAHISALKIELERRDMVLAGITTEKVLCWYLDIEDPSQIDQPGITAMPGNQSNSKISSTIDTSTPKEQQPPGGGVVEIPASHVHDSHVKARDVKSDDRVETKRFSKRMSRLLSLGGAKSTNQKTGSDYEDNVSLAGIESLYESFYDPQCDTCHPCETPSMQSNHITPLNSPANKTSTSHQQPNQMIRSKPPTTPTTPSNFSAPPPPPPLPPLTIAPTKSSVTKYGSYDNNSAYPTPPSTANTSIQSMSSCSSMSQSASSMCSGSQSCSSLAAPATSVSENKPMKMPQSRGLALQRVMSEESNQAMRCGEGQRQRRRALVSRLSQRLDQSEEAVSSANNKPSVFDFEKVMSKLEQLDKLDSILRKINKLAERGHGGFSLDERTKDVSDLEGELEAQLKVIMGGSSSMQQLEVANIMYEKLSLELERHPDYAERKRKMDEEREKREGPINAAALSELRAQFAPERIAESEELRARLRRNPELSLINMDHQAILTRHQNDYRHFVLTGLSGRELRAIYAALPQFRRDQTVQMQFKEHLLRKIQEVEQREAQQAAGRARPLVPLRKAVSLKVGRSAEGSGAGRGGLLQELARRRPVFE